jgi:uncharacterized protein (DUF1697 family)
MENTGKNSARRYVAFLRGINVGGHASIRMADLQAAFAGMGLREVRTVLASGNVIFNSERSDQKAISREIESGLKKAFNKSIGVVLRSLDELEKLRSSEPFRGIELTPGIRLYVTFLAGEASPRTIVIPYSSANGDFRILQATGGEVISVVDLAQGKGTPEAMGIIEKEFGANVTTRNWNTVLKILQ